MLWKRTSAVTKRNDAIRCCRALDCQSVSLDCWHCGSVETLPVHFLRSGLSGKLRSRRVRELKMVCFGTRPDWHGVSNLSCINCSGGGGVSGSCPSKSKPFFLKLSTVQD